MRIIDTSVIDERTALNPDVTSWVYNGLDCCLTFEIRDKLREELAREPQNVAAIYSLALDKSAPFLEMSMRGLRVDPVARSSTIKDMNAKLDRLKAQFRRLTTEIFGAPVSPTSPVQVKTLFYDWLGIKPILKRNTKGAYTPTVDEDALKRIAQHFTATIFVSHILAIRGLAKAIGFLETQIDEDSRMRTSLNIAGTNTGRTASSRSDFGTGTNLQNVDSALRFPFIADEGKLLVNVDLEQADSRNVGALIYEILGDPGYLDACESGDTHPTVCRLSWPELDWPENPKEWKAFCDGFSPPGIRDSYRQCAKKLGHASNYLGKPPAIAKNTGVPQKIVEDFQRRYFAAFPGIPEWQKWTIEQIKSTATLTTLYGRRRHFYGRRDDAATHRAAIAYSPQSMTGHQIDSGILNLWRHMPEAELLIQVHDSILFQIPRDRTDLIPTALELLKFTVKLRGNRDFFVPLEAKTGYNWGDRRESKGEVLNPWGLAKWKGQELREPPKRIGSPRS